MECDSPKIHKFSIDPGYVLIRRTVIFNWNHWNQISMRIILADHHPQSRWAVNILLEVEPDFDLIGEAVDAQGLLDLVRKNPTDLVLVDRELPGGSIEDIIASLRTLIPPPVVVVMSSEFEYSRILLQAGADAFVSKTDQSDWLLDTLHKYANQVKMKQDAQKGSIP
jgi:DNA-binding NarL/FixJ family response regulator